MSRARLFETVLDSTGRPIAGASVAVYEPGTTTSISETLYADDTGGTTLTNPLATGTDGSVLAYLALPKRVDLLITAVGQTPRTVPDVGLFPDPADLVTGTDLGNHAGAGDPHPAYVLDTDLTTHAGAADPHTGYQKESEKGAASGYAPLGAGSLVPIANLASGTPNGTKFIRDDGTLVLPPGSTPTTTRGDIIKRGASADERLAIGTVGQGLVVADIGSGVLEPRYATPAVAGMTKIDRQVLGSAAASVTFSSIPGTYGSLLLVIYARGDTAAGSTTLLMRFNSDTGANYDRQLGYAAAASLGALEQIAATSLGISSIMPANTAPANQFGSARLDIPQYAATVGRKTVTGVVYGPQGDGTGAKVTYMAGGEWRSTAAITSITLLPGAGNFAIGSAFALYGLEA